MVNLPDMLPDAVVEQLVSYISDNGQSIGLNSLDGDSLGTKVFSLLETKCIVLYYPIEDADEENSAFLLPSICLRSGERKDVVFINTFQTSEKQVFAAAHELAHVLGVARSITADHAGISDFQERIAGRFAAELLMPRVEFYTFFNEALAPYKEKRRIPLDKLLAIIVSAMNHYFVPYKSVVLRMAEVKVISLDTASILYSGNGKIPESGIRTRIRKIISSSSDYSELQKRNMKKEIKGPILCDCADLPALLKKAQDMDLVPTRRIERIRKTFDLSTSDESLVL